MPKSLKILFVSAEAAPFAKTGGLGDVAGVLPVYLKKLGHDVRLVLPKYSSIDTGKYNISPAISYINVNMGEEECICTVHQTTIDENVPVYFIGYDAYFARPNLYHDNDFNDYPDNPKRYSLFSKAALQLCHFLKFNPDIVHANDWHTAVIPAYLKRLYYNDTLLKRAASILTIHNIAYQGRYADYYFGYTGLPADDFSPDRFECYGAVNFLKGGIQFADAVNTVSPGYASETLSPGGSYGMDSFLSRKGDNYVGILNGVDYSQWNPETDKLIPANYTPENMKGKAVCKQELQKKLNLDVTAKTAVIGIVSRLVEQKGFYVLRECMEGMVANMDVQFAVLGAGDKLIEQFFSYLLQKYPGKVGVNLGYDNQLAHMIEAGSDFFLMPSIYEPCGLNQIYSLKYGTLPIVRATGGLNDTVENYNQKTGEGTGFKFWEPSGKAIYNTVKWVLDTYYNRKPHIKKLVQKAMKQHFSWEESAAEYVKLYKKAIGNRIAQ